MVQIYGKGNITALYINDVSTPIPPDYRVEMVRNGVRIVYVNGDTRDVVGKYNADTPDMDIMNAILDHMRNNNYAV